MNKIKLKFIGTEKKINPLDPTKRILPNEEFEIEEGYLAFFNEKEFKRISSENLEEKKETKTKRK